MGSNCHVYHESTVSGEKGYKSKKDSVVFEVMRLLVIPRILLKLPVFIERIEFTFAFHLKWSQCLLISDTTHQM